MVIYFDVGSVGVAEVIVKVAPHLLLGFGKVGAV